MDSSFKVAVVQNSCSADKRENLALYLEKIRSSATLGAQVICLEELCLNRYFCSQENHEFFSLAEPIPGPSTKAIQELARELGVVVIFPIFEKQMPGVYCNSAAVIDADGALLGVYRKMHIPDDPLYYEKFYFTPGDTQQDSSGYRVFKTRFGTIAVLICWDQWYPEAARICALLGAQIIFYPTAIGWHPEEKAEFGSAQREAWQTIQRSHAIANGVYVAAANRVGHEPTTGTAGIEFFGNSFICDPFGRILTQAGETESTILVSEVDPQLVETTRLHWPFFRDRRIDSYAPILARTLVSQ